MKTLTKSDITAWCGDHGLIVAGKDWPKFEGEDRFTFLVKQPKSSYQSVALARWCFPFNHDGSFPGAMVWFKDWGIWNDVDEETWMSLLQKFRAAANDQRPLIETPGHLFLEKEFVDARACWSLPVIFGWDAFLFPLGANFFAFNSHDEVLSIVSRDQSTHEVLLNEFKDWEIEKSDWYFRGV